MPRLRISSLNEVMVSSCAIWARGRTCRCRAGGRGILARELVDRGTHRQTETPRSWLSWRSEGIAFPTPTCSIRSKTWSRVWLCLVVRWGALATARAS